MQKQAQIQITRLKQENMQKTALSKATALNQESISRKGFLFLPDLPRLHGRGISGWDETSLSYKYRFRKSKIGLPWNTKTTSKLIKKLRGVKL